MKFIAYLALIGSVVATQTHNEAALDTPEDDMLLDTQDYWNRQPCEYLDETNEELDYQMDMFSRTLNTNYL
jgi:hypothetical protein